MTEKTRDTICIVITKDAHAKLGDITKVLCDKADEEGLKARISKTQVAVKAIEEYYKAITAGA